MKTKVCVVIPRSHGIGGMELHALEHALYLADNFDVTLLVSESVPTAVRDLLQVKAGGMLRFVDLRSLLNGCRVVKHYGQDAVIIHEGNFMDTPWRFALICRCFSKKVMLCLHAMPPMYPPAGSKKYRLGLWWRRIRLKGRLHALICQQVTAVSRSVAARLADSFCLAVQDIAVFPVVIDVDRFFPCDYKTKMSYRRRFQLPSHSYVVGFVGRLSTEKGLLITLDIAEKLALSPTGRDLHFVFVGDGPLKVDLQKRIERTPLLGSATTTIGFVNDIACLMPCLDVLLMPSETEGFPRVLLEAMACGIPAIVSDILAFHELLSFCPGLANGIYMVEQPTVDAYIANLAVVRGLCVDECAVVAKRLRESVVQISSLKKYQDWWNMYLTK